MTGKAPKASESSHKTVANLSISLIESAFLLLTERSLPVYQRNIDRPRPPVATRENVNAAAAIVMLTTGLDYHLCRLKYLRDVSIPDPPLPHTPYFNWTFGHALSKKLRQLLMGVRGSRLLRQLIEITVCRDAIVHPKFYTVTHSRDAHLIYTKLKAELPVGATLDPKAIENKMRRRDFTKLLKLPLVPTWVSYVDGVVCILVFHRLLNLLEARYGNPYAWVGGITAYEDQTKPLFTGWNWHRAHPRELEDWAKAFFQSLSADDQGRVKKNLGGQLDPYLKKRLPKIRLPAGSNPSLAAILKAIQRPPKKPDFLSKPPPHFVQK